MKTIQAAVISSACNLNLVIPNVEESVPNNCFGVFVTFRRLVKSEVKNEYQLSGCIGWWHPNHSVVSPSVLAQKALSVAKSAAQDDPRNRAFSKPIWKTASEVNVEISFMNHPHPVSSKTPHVEGGVLVRTFENKRDQKRATFLPHVYGPEKTWSQVQQLLKQKANIGMHEAVEFYQYDTLELTCGLFDLLQSDLFKQWMSAQFLQAATIGTFGHWMPGDDVRNVGVLHSLLQISHFLKDASVQQKVRPIVLDYLKKKTNIQTRAFLLACCALLQLNDQVKQLCDEFSKSNFQTMEQTFTVGEVLAAMGPNCTFEFPMSVISNVADIFECNWKMQALVQNKIPLPQSFEQKALAFAASTVQAQSETNVLAVTLEMLSFLRQVSQKNKNTVQNALFKTFCYVDQRWNAQTKEYCFLSGCKSNRLDIFGHILNGVLNL